MSSTFRPGEPRLTFSIEGVDVRIAFDRWDALQNDRARWLWEFSCPGSTPSDRWVIASGDDLTTVGFPNYAKALATLGSFLEAWAEYPDGENKGLFPESMRDSEVDWVYVADMLQDACGENDPGNR